MMKNKFIFLLIQTVVILSTYFILLNLLAGTNILAGIFCPGPHQPDYYPVIIGLFIFARLGVLILPGILLSRVFLNWHTPFR